MDPSLLSILSRISFATATFITSLLLAKSMHPPQPIISSGKSTTADTLFGKHTSSISALGLAFRIGILSLGVLNAFAALSGPPTYTALFGAFGSRTVHIDKTFVTWNRTSTLMLAIIAATAWLRLQAMRELGSSFTFDLRVPKTLVTKGMYRYVQHPSYTSGMLCIAGGTWYFLRLDGAIGAFLPELVFKIAGVTQLASPVIAVAVVYVGLRVRVREEEAMLREKFGHRWEEWNASTARFIPFVL